jgi:hypothetical protein
LVICILVECRNDKKQDLFKSINSFLYGKTSFIVIYLCALKWTHVTNTLDFPLGFASTDVAQLKKKAINE